MSRENVPPRSAKTEGDTKPHGPVFRHRALYVAIGLSFALSAQAGEWQFSSNIRTEQTYTNNISADGSDEEESGFVSEISPGISLRRQGARMSVDLNYHPDFVFYPGHSDNNRIDHTLDGRGELEAVENFFYVETRANVTQQFLSPAGARPQSGAVNTDNRYTASSYSINPYIRGKLFGDNDYLLRNENIWTKTSQVSGTDDLSDIYTNRTMARFDTPITTFGLSLEYDDRHTEYDNEDDDEVDTEIVRAIVHYRYDSELTVSLRTGYEKNDLGAGEDTGGVYGVGVRWNPSPRTSLDGFWESHYYGPSYNAKFMHRQKRATYMLSVSRAVSTYDDSLNNSMGLGTTWYQFFDQMAMNDPALRNNATARDTAVRAELASRGLTPNQQANMNSVLFTEDAQLIERLDAALILEGARNSFEFGLYLSKTKAVSGSDSTFTFIDPVTDSIVEAEAVKEAGAQVSWNHKLTPLATLMATVSRTYSTTEGATPADPDVDSTEDTFTLRLTHSLGPKTNGFAGLRFTNSDGDEGASDYDERAVFAGFDHRF